MPVEGLTKWAKFEDTEENGIITLKIVIDKSALIREALPALLSKMNEPITPVAPPKLRKPRAKKGAAAPPPPPPADLSGQGSLPFAEGAPKGETIAQAKERAKREAAAAPAVTA
jgi:hypothetical protein